MIKLENFPDYREKMYVIDASNISALEKNGNGKYSFDTLILTIRQLFQKGIKYNKIIIFADSSLKYKIDKTVDYKVKIDSEN